MQIFLSDYVLRSNYCLYACGRYNQQQDCFLVAQGGKLIIMDISETVLGKFDISDTKFFDKELYHPIREKIITLTAFHTLLYICTVHSSQINFNLKS